MADGVSGTIKELILLLERHAWIACATAAFVIFLPLHAAASIGILGLRQKYEGLVWIIFLFFGLLAIHRLISFVANIAYVVWVEDWKERREELRRRRAVEAALDLRLRSMSPQEMLWIVYSLYHNMQTLPAVPSCNVAISLLSKGFLSRGGLTATGQLFHMTDDAWRFINSKKDMILEEIFQMAPEERRQLFEEFLHQINSYGF